MSFTTASTPSGRTAWWACSLAGLALLVAAQSALFSLHLPYYRWPDQDLILAYNALVMNSRFPQEYFDHTGYTYFLLLSAWFQVLHGLGLLPIDQVTAIPPVADPTAFATAWQQIIEAGRLLTIGIFALFTTLFAQLIAWLFDDRRIGFSAGLLLATGEGAVHQVGLMRTEPLSALLVMGAVLLAALAGREEWRGWRLPCLGAAAFLGILAVETKVFAIVPLLAAPAIAVTFGTTRRYDSTPGQVRPVLLALLLIGAILLAIPAAGVVWTGLAGVGKSIYAYHPVGGGLLDSYQALMVLWVLAWLAAYAVLWRLPPMDAVAAAAALAIGASLGVLVLLVRYNLQNVIAATHPIEQMFVFSSASNPTLAGAQTIVSGAILLKLGLALWSVLSRPLLNPFSDNVFPLDWFIVIGLVVGRRDSERRWMVQAGLLFATSLALQTVFLLRYDQKIYHVYSDPFAILAAAVILTRFRGLLTSRPGLIATTVALFSYASWGIVSGAKFDSARGINPSASCDWHSAYLPRLEPFPFCREAPQP